MRRVAEGAIAGIAGGVVAGIAARTAMRLVALGLPDGIGQNPSFTPAGTAMIMAIGGVIGAPLGVTFALIRASLPGPRWSNGLIFGVILFVALGPLFFVGAADEFTNAGRVVLFVPLFPIFGVVAGVAFASAQRVARSTGRTVHLALGAFAAGGAALIAFGIATLGREIFDSRGPTSALVFASWIVVALAMRVAARSRTPVAAPGH